MPYIKKESRVKFDDAINKLAEEINEPGELNYCIYALLNRIIKKHTECYRLYSALIADVDCAKMEFYRKRVGPYEDKKIKSNGDVR
jgi:hypothetical protein